MKKRFSFILSLALLLVAKTFSQQPDFLFEHRFPYPILHTVNYEHIETFTLEVAPDDTTEGFYLISTGDGKNSNWYEIDPVSPPIVYKVSLEGELLGELALGSEDSYSVVTRLFFDPEEPNCCLAIGSIHHNDLHYDRPFLAKFDTDLNLLWQREIELPEAYHGYIWTSAFMDSSGDIACCLGVSGIPAPVFCRLTTEGELIAISQYTGPCTTFNITCGGFFEFHDGSGDYGKTVEYDSGPTDDLYLIRINRDLELVSNQILPREIREGASSSYQELYLGINPQNYAIFSMPDGSVVFGGDATLGRLDYQYDWTFDDVIGFIRLDQDCNILSYASVGQGEIGVGNDSIKAIRGNTCTDMVGKDAFYFYHMVGEPYGFGYDWINCFVVTKMDIDGNVIWQRYWNRYYPEYGMKVYWPFSIMTTTDNGCLVSGTSYYSDIYGSPRDITEAEFFMLKFFADGTLSVPEAEAIVRPYAFYPNPANDQLRLQYSPDVKPAQIELYDLQGRLVRSQGSGLESFNLQGLAPGQYVMKVTMADGTVFSDKVVKE